MPGGEPIARRRSCRQIRSCIDTNNTAEDVTYLKQRRCRQHGQGDHLESMASCDDDNRRDQNRRNKNENLKA